MKQPKKPALRFKGFVNDWEQRKLGECCQEFKSGSFISASDIGDVGKYPVYGGNGLRGFSAEYNHDGEFALIGRQGALCGNMNYSVGRAYFTEHAIAVQANKTADTKFLYYLLRKMNLGQYSDQSAQPGLAVGKLVKLTELFPSVAEQIKIGHQFMGIDNLITLHQCKQKTLFFMIGSDKMIGFDKESEFEKALIRELQKNGWDEKVLHHPTEADLIDNWAHILFENNRDIDRLNECELVPEEMEQLVNQIKNLKTPLALNDFINGKTVAITRKNPEDTLHYNKEVSLKIYDRMEIAAGQSRYQIAEQPEFSCRKGIYPKRRGDLMLLINGMPVFHIELKRSGVDVAEACHQIDLYAREQVFTGIFSLVQVFVAMNPQKTLYYANPGPEGNFNPDFYFHWENFNNDIVDDWREIAHTLLSIPMAHQLIGFYTVADDADGILKVMRSYQYYAANKISDTVSKHNWKEQNQLGGYIWHTTGSGKTDDVF